MTERMVKLTAVEVRLVELRVRGVDKVRIEIVSVLS